MKQSTLFDVQESPARARRSDPATSHKAAAELESKLARLQAEALERARDVCSCYGNATANEIAYDMVDGTVIESLRKRVHELVCKQLLIFAGTRLCSVTEKRCRAYKVANIEIQK